jgi:hypothetical protein
VGSSIIAKLKNAATPVKAAFKHRNKPLSISLRNDRKGILHRPPICPTLCSGLPSSQDCFFEVCDSQLDRGKAIQWKFIEPDQGSGTDLSAL